MSDDFKEKILKYLTGNIQQESGINEPQFEPTQTITNNLYQYMLDNFDDGSHQAPYIIDIIKSNFNDNYLCYGNGHNFGFVIILDSNFQIIESTREYTSGTTMNIFLKLNQAPNGTFYGIDKNGNNYRFIMLNNMLSKTPNQTNYKYVIQKSYNITSNYPSNFTLIDMIKNSNGGEYLFYGYKLINSNFKPLAIEYKVNVGMANEWIEYNYSTVDNNSYYITGGWASWDAESNISFKLIGNLDTTTNTLVYIFNKSGTGIILEQTYDTNIDISQLGEFDALEMKTVILSETNAYVIAYIRSSQPKVYVFRINNGIYNLYESESASGIIGQFVTFGIKTDYINTYIWYLLPSGSYYDFYGGLIINDEIYQTLITNTNVYPLNLQISFNQYNLYSFNLQSANTLYNVSFVYNQFDYNGLEYENINSLVPKSAILLEDSDDPKIIFARNLYNINVNGATTISTLEIPNTFLNNETIVGKQLYSETKTLISSDASPLEKNFYEVVDINFFNTLTMKNSNNPNDEIINNEGASRLNTSMSKILDYENAQANKIRINYQDGTNLIQTIWKPFISSGIAMYLFTIYVPKEITDIEIISNDEITSYQTITGSFEIGKYYSLTQNVRVE